MKKISAFCISGFIALGFSMSLHAQSSQQDLDQVELMKQFIGEWKHDSGNDTVSYISYSPYGKGYLFKAKWQANGETYNEAQGIIGYANSYKRINMFFLWQEGTMARDLGQFDTQDKLVMKRRNANFEVNFAIWEWTFLTPDKAKFVYKRRKWSDENWDNATITESIFERVKK